MRRVLLVAVRDLKVYGTKPLYIVSVFAVPALSVLLGVFAIGNSGGAEAVSRTVAAIKPVEVTVGWVDPASYDIVTAARRITQVGGRSAIVSDRRFPSDAAARQAITEGSVSAAVVSDHVALVSESAEADVERLLQRAAAHHQLQELTVTDAADQQIDQILDQSTLTIHQIPDPRKTTVRWIDVDGFPWWARYLFPPAILAAILILAVPKVMIGMTIERNSPRVPDILLCHLRPVQLVVGKVIGLGILGLTQSWFVVLGGVALVVALGAGVGTVVWWALGYVVYAGLAASAGTRLTTTTAEVGSLLIIALASLGMFVGVAAAVYSPAPWVTAVTLAPWWAPFTVPIRAALESIPVWEYVLAVVTTVGFGGWLIWWTGRTYGRV